MAAAAEPHHPLQEEYEKFLPTDLARELVKQFVRLKQRAWAGDHEGVQEAGGKVAEHSLRAAQHLAGVRMIALREEIRNLPRECEDLGKLPRPQASDAVRVVIPRVISTIYTLRSKRSGGHTAAEVDPSQADAFLTERLADWLMVEFFRIGHEMPLDQAEGVIATLVDRRIPAVYRVGDFKRVLKPGLSPQQEILVLVYAEPNGATVPELKEWSRIPSSSLDRYLRNLERDRLIRFVPEGRTRRVFLLPTSERKVEEERLLEPE